MPHNPPPNTKPHAKLPFARRQLTPHPAAEPASRIARCPVLLALSRLRAAPVSLAPLVRDRAGNGEDCPPQRFAQFRPSLDDFLQIRAGRGNWCAYRCVRNCVPQAICRFWQVRNLRPYNTTKTASDDQASLWRNACPPAPGDGPCLTQPPEVGRARHRVPTRASRLDKPRADVAQGLQNRNPASITRFWPDTLIQPENGFTT